MRSSASRRALGWATLIVLAWAVHLLLVWLMVSRQADFLFNDAQHRLGPGTDLAAYYDAGRAWLDGRSIFGHGAGFGYRYHPFLAMSLAATLARGTFLHAYIVWLLIFEVLFVADFVALRRLIGSTRRYLALGAILLFFSPLYLDLYMGNASFIAASLMLLAWWCDRMSWRALFRLLFVVSVLVKPIGLVIVPVLLIGRRFKDAAIIVGAIGLLAVPYFAYHPDDWRALITSNVRVSPGWLVHAGNQGLHGFLTAMLTRIEGIPTWRLASYGQLGLASRSLLILLPVALMAITLRASWIARERPEVGVFLWLCVYLLGFNDVWEQSYAILVLGLGLIWSLDVVPWRTLVICSIGLALPTLFATYDLNLPPGPYDPEHGWSTAISLFHHATKPFWLLVLYVTCLRRVERLRHRVLHAEPEFRMAA